MNIEIANRLYQYRKENNLSQEELAAKIGVSRQAVSKWERAEASPDTDNLILLARLYGVTLDELLQGKAEQSAPSTDQAEAESSESVSSEFSPEPDEEYVESDRISLKNGIHIHSKDGDKVDISFKDGVNVQDSDGSKVCVNRSGVNICENGKTKVYTDENGRVFHSKDIDEERHAFKDKAKSKKKNFFLAFPFPIIVIIAYLLFGVFDVCGGFAFGWIVFLTIPLYYTLVEAIIKKNPSIFCYPVFTVAVYLITGFVWSLWHPMWIIFLTVPVYYSICEFIKKRKD